MNRTAGPTQNLLRSDFMNPSANMWDWTGQWDVDTLCPWADGNIWPWSRWSGGIGWFGNDTQYTNRWAQPPDELGGAQMLKLRGITRDSTGAVLSSAVVQGFLTASDLFLRQVTSDAGGYFELPSEYAAMNHYLVAYKANSPDVAGTTVNTLQPT